DVLPHPARSWRTSRLTSPQPTQQPLRRALPGGDGALHGGGVQVIPRRHQRRISLHLPAAELPEATQVPRLEDGIAHSPPVQPRAEHLPADSRPGALEIGEDGIDDAPRVLIDQFGGSIWTGEGD